MPISRSRAKHRLLRLRERVLSHALLAVVNTRAARVSHEHIPSEKGHLINFPPVQPSLAASGRYISKNHSPVHPEPISISTPHRPTRLSIARKPAARYSRLVLAETRLRARVVALSPWPRLRHTRMQKSELCSKAVLAVPFCK